MAESSDSVSIDMETISLTGKDYLIKTSHGFVSVAVFGDRDKPALVTYPDLALSYVSCFEGLLMCPEAFSLLLHNFCIYHISPPGHELGATIMRPDDPVLSVDDLADQVAEILDFFGLSRVMCMGVTAGAYILTLFAIKYSCRVLGLILVSPLCQGPCWTEWLYNKVKFRKLLVILESKRKGVGTYGLEQWVSYSYLRIHYLQVMSNLLYFYGMCGLVKELLLVRYFSKDVRGNVQVLESEVVQACRRFLGERQSPNVLRFLEIINGRRDISEGLKRLQCRSLIFIGENSPFHHESLHMTSKLDRRYTALVEVQHCGSVVTEEQPDAMLIPLEYFLMGYGFYRPSQYSLSPRSPLSPTCISPELFSPESMGLKLKPIKTRIPLEI